MFEMIIIILVVTFIIAFAIILPQIKHRWWINNIHGTFPEYYDPECFMCNETDDEICRKCPKFKDPTNR